MRPESALYKVIVEYLRLQGAFAWREANIPVPGRAQSKLTFNGMPDIIAIFLSKIFLYPTPSQPATVIAVEVKRSGEKLSVDQENVKKLTENRGVIWITAYSLDDVIKIVQKLRIEGKIA